MCDILHYNAITVSNGELKDNNLQFIFSKGLIMASLNINSLLRHIDELRVFISHTNIDIGPCRIFFFPQKRENSDDTFGFD